MRLRARRPVRLTWPAATLLAASLTTCTEAKKPSDADIAAYITQSEPAYVKVSGISPSFEAAKDLGKSPLPEGSWRVKVAFTLTAQQDLYAPAPGAAQTRTDFDRAISAAEAFRIQRIQAVNSFAAKAGLMKPGATGPSPALAVAIATHKGGTLQDHVTLLAEPSGQGWKFFQLDAQTLSDDTIGAPVADLRQENARLTVVVAGSDEEKAAQARQKQFLNTLAKVPPP